MQLQRPTDHLCVLCVQRLLKHPELSNSQLLADFLSPHSEESQFLDKTLADVRLGTIITELQPSRAGRITCSFMVCWLALSSDV